MGKSITNNNRYAEEIKALTDPFDAIRSQYERNPLRQAVSDAYYEQLKPEGKRLILSIDGGGTRGYITLHCLARMEELACRPAYEIFDFYAGTSTGSLIAAGLAAKFSAHKLLEIYRTYIPRIFKEGWLPRMVGNMFGPASVAKYLALLQQNKFRYMYSYQELWDICYGILGDLTFGDLYHQSVEDSGGSYTKRLMITAKDLKRGETLFMVNAGPGAAAFNQWRVASAIVASSVAPAFIQPYRVFVDGGVGSFGNPCYIAMVEATEYFTGEIQPSAAPYVPQHDDLCYLHENVIHFSFGTGVKQNTMASEDDVASKNIVNWLLYIISEGLDDANSEQVQMTQARFCRGNNWYSQSSFNRRVDFRRYQVSLDAADLVRPAATPSGTQRWVPGLQMTLNDVEVALLHTLELNSNSPSQLDLMARIGKAWAYATDFTRQHPPYAGDYSAPGGPLPLEDILTYVQKAAA